MCCTRRCKYEDLNGKCELENKIHKYLEENYGYSACYIGGGNKRPDRY